MLQALNKGSEGDRLDTSYTIVALSYRGYWTSRGRPSQKGIELDAQAALSWTFNELSPPTPENSVILWGQSIGAGVATTTAATHLTNHPRASQVQQNKYISGLVLETPFVSIRSMLTALYPQRWLPYRYLWPFLWNWWDSEAALREIANSVARPSVLIVQAEKDEIVPDEQTDQLERVCREVGIDVTRKSVRGAYHTEVLAKGQGRMVIENFLRAPH